MAKPDKRKRDSSKGKARKKIDPQRLKRAAEVRGKTVGGRPALEPAPETRDADFPDIAPDRQELVQKLRKELLGELLTTAEVAAILEVHPRTVGEYIREGKLQAIAIGGSWRIPEVALRNFVNTLLFERPREGAPPAQESRGRGGRGMFERFTDRARRVIVLAQEEARLMNHGYIGTEHLLLGLISEGQGVAAKALETLEVNLFETREEIEEMIGRGSKPFEGHIPFTPRSKKVLELTLREALQMGHNYIGTEHMLLALIREGEGVAAQVLQKRGVNLDVVRVEVMRQLSQWAADPASRAKSQGKATPAKSPKTRAKKAGAKKKGTTRKKKT